MKSGNTLWNELCLTYQKGVDKVDSWNEVWVKAQPYVDPALFEDVNRRLEVQGKDARWWRDACLLYFQQFSGMPLPEGVGKPAKSLKEYKEILLPISNYENPDGNLLDKFR